MSGSSSENTTVVVLLLLLVTSLPQATTVAFGSMFKAIPPATLLDPTQRTLPVDTIDADADDDQDTSKRG